MIRHTPQFYPSLSLWHARARIWGYLKTRHFAHQKQLLRKDIPVLKVLPQSLSSDLNNELYVPILKTCPVFYFYGVVHYYGLCGICDSNVTEA